MTSYQDIEEVFQNSNFRIQYKFLSIILILSIIYYLFNYSQ